MYNIQGHLYISRWRLAAPAHAARAREAACREAAASLLASVVSCGELRLVDVARPDPEVETMDAEAALRTLVTLDTWLEQGVMEVRHVSFV